MKTYPAVMLSCTLMLLASALPAQTSADLATSIDAWFSVDAPGTTNPTAPTLRPLAGTFRTAALGVRNDMNAIGGNTDITCTTAAGYIVRWVNGSVSWTQNGVILLATGADDAWSPTVTVVLTGDASSAYAVGGDTTAVPGAGGHCEVDLIPSTVGGEAGAWGGNGTGSGYGGLALVWRQALCSGWAIGGDTTGSGQPGIAWVEADFDAYARSGTTGSANPSYTTTAISWGNGSAVAIGANSTAGLGGDALAYCMHVSGVMAFAQGGNGGAGGGNAHAEGYGFAEAIGGNSSTNNGGDAVAKSYLDGAEATGGDSDDADGGNATAEAYLDAIARGGHSLNGLQDTLGGFAYARIYGGGTGDADARGGTGNEGGGAHADTYGDTMALAIGGDGFLGAGATSSRGGGAIAHHFTSGGQALAASGDAAPGTGLGGDAIAVNHLNNSNVFFATSWQGGFVTAP